LNTAQSCYCEADIANIYQLTLCTSEWWPSR